MQLQLLWHNATGTLGAVSVPPAASRALDLPGTDALTAGATDRAGATPRRRSAGTLVRRAASMLGVLAVLSVGVFALTYAAPGSPEQALTAGRPVSPQQLQVVRERYHLDDPVWVQYGTWLGHAVRLDFGRSYRSDEPVRGLVSSRALVSLELAGLAFLMVLAVSLPLALLAAVRRRSAVDRTISALAAVGVATPPFALAVLLLFVFGVKLGWFPVFGAGSGVLDRLWHLALPALALAVGLVALVLKIARAALVTTLEQDYVTFARSRGLSRRQVLLTYALRNSLGPVATAAGLTFGSLIASTVLVEQTFAVPGIGTLLVGAVNNQDLPVIQGVSLALAAIILMVNLLTDVVYTVIDPRLELKDSLS